MSARENNTQQKKQSIINQMLENVHEAEQGKEKLRCAMDKEKQLLDLTPSRRERLQLIKKKKKCHNQMKFQRRNTGIKRNKEYR